MKKVFLVISVSIPLFTGCVGSGAGLGDVVTGLTTGLVGGTSTVAASKTMNLSEITDKTAAFDSGYALVELRGAVESEAQKAIIISYINGVKGKLDELEVEKETIASKQNLAVRDKATRGVLGNDSKVGEALGDFTGGLGDLQLIGSNSRLQAIQSEIFLAKKLLIRTKSMIQ